MDKPPTAEDTQSNKALLIPEGISLTGAMALSTHEHKLFADENVPNTWPAVAGASVIKNKDALYMAAIARMTVLLASRKLHGSPLLGTRKSAMMQGRQLLLVWIQLITPTEATSGPVVTLLARSQWLREHMLRDSSDDAHAALFMAAASVLDALADYAPPDLDEAFVSETRGTARLLHKVAMHAPTADDSATEAIHLAVTRISRLRAL